MLAEGYQVVDVLMLVGNLLPLSLYFLILGLVNSHARPCLITSRSDFLVLTSVLVPVLLWPVPDLVRGQMYHWLGAILLFASAIFFYLLPARDAGFVIYNLTQSRCRRLLDHVFERMGLSGRWLGNTWRADGLELSLELREFSLLSNVSLHFESGDAEARSRINAIGSELDRRLDAIRRLPSNMGIGLVMAGITLMILPMWMVGRHIHDLVDAMLHLFG